MNPNTRRYLLLMVALGGLVTAVFWPHSVLEDEVVPASTTSSQMSQIFNDDLTIRTTTIPAPADLNEFFEQLTGVRP
jgi:hypothetical protein